MIQDVNEPPYVFEVDVVIALLRRLCDNSLINKRLDNCGQVIESID